MFDAQVFLKTVSSAPGVYQMFGSSGQLLYVGKAKSLKKRLASYFRADLKDNKTRSLVSQIHSIETIVTRTEQEALLLENNLIKLHRPKYNILFRDDKSYPYIYLSADAFPRLSIYRGTKKEKGHYFGPYPDGGIARESVHILQKLFNIRHCKNSVFKARSRPCLQYQIKRCSAPCVGLISQEEYAKNIALVKQFLAGEYSCVIQKIVERMQAASEQQDYEAAALYRDQIQLLHQIQSDQLIYHGVKDIDVIAVVQKHQVVCIDVLMIRHGRVLGNKHFLKSVESELSESDILSTFMAQYYLNESAFIPSEIILNIKPQDLKLLSEAITQHAQKRVQLKTQVSRQRKEWLTMASANAETVLNAHFLNEQVLYKQFYDLQQLLQLEALPKRIECFDISHTGGTATVASCVVFSPAGPQKNSYRQFNIKGITAQDDFAALRQAIKRRYEQALQKNGVLPDILMIDGGKGQLKQAEKIFNELGIDEVLLISIAKGEKRKAGLETIYRSGSSEPVSLIHHDLAFQLLQQVRDEAHRFAITRHRNKRAQNMRRSVLENIPGIGKKRRTQLLQYFGGLQAIQAASISALTKVPGINKEIAERIYHYLKDQAH